MLTKCFRHAKRQLGCVIAWHAELALLTSSRKGTWADERVLSSLLFYL